MVRVSLVRLLFFILLGTGVASAQAQEKAQAELLAWLQDLPAPWTLNESTLGEELALFHDKFPGYEDRLMALSYWRLGTPYKIFNLGEETPPDADPIFRLDVSDCTSHILTTMSLAESKTWQEARRTLIDIHYKPNQSGAVEPVYNRRWHYTSDRVLHHALTPQVTSALIDKSKLKSVSLTLNKKSDGSEFLPLNWSKDISIDYLPVSAFTPEILEQLPDLIGVAFVKESFFNVGVVMAHEGMIVHRKYLLHAGQVAQKTVIEDLLEYLFVDGNPRFDGLVFFEIKPMNPV